MEFGETRAQSHFRGQFTSAESNRGCRLSGGSPNRNRQVERRVERQVESQVDDLFGSKNRQPDFLPDVLPDVQPDDFYLETPLEEAWEAEEISTLQKSKLRFYSDLLLSAQKLINWISAPSVRAVRAGKVFSTAFRRRRSPFINVSGRLTCCSWRAGRRRGASRPGSTWPRAAGTATASRAASPPPRCPWWA